MRSLINLILFIFCISLLIAYCDRKENTKNIFQTSVDFVSEQYHYADSVFKSKENYESRN